MSLTKEQEIFLQSLEKEFENRYTELDEEFKTVLNAKPSTPPVYENYFERFDQREGYDDNRAHSYNNSYDRSRGYDDYHSRERFRSRSYGDYNSRERSRSRNYGEHMLGRSNDNRFRNRRDYRERYSSQSPYDSGYY